MGGGGMGGDIEGCSLLFVYSVVPKNTILGIFI